MEIKLSGFYKSVIVIAGIFTLGIGALAMWLQLRSWPKRIDAEGITLRNGKHLTWGEFTEKRNVTVINQMGHQMASRVELVFGKTIVRIVAPSLKNGYEVISYVDQILQSHGKA